MATAKFHTLEGIQLPRGMRWSDEFGEWSAVARATEYGAAGALFVDVGTRQAGRPITLVAAHDQGHIRRDTLAQLRTLVDTASDQPLTLTLADGRAFEVTFAPGDTPLDATLVGYAELPAPDQRYVATLRLIVLAELP